MFAQYSFLLLYFARVVRIKSKKEDINSQVNNLFYRTCGTKSKGPELNSLSSQNKQKFTLIRHEADGLR